MKSQYFQDTDTLYIAFQSVEVAETKDLDENTLLDVDHNGHICGITIEHASAVVVQANISGQASQTKVGDVVYLGDVVQTGTDGRVGINFTDGTSFNLSSNARMALTEFVYDPNGKSNSSLLSLTKGTFTFVAGKIAKTGDMKIDTPVATMGIRGTTPRIEISDDGTVKFATLIEEGKSKLTKKPGPPTAPQLEQKTDQKPNLNICRGC